MQAVLSFQVSRPFADAEAAVRAALQAEGFGILTEVDVQATLKAKLGVDVPPQKLLGACNPKLAHAALQGDPRVGAFLPCGLSLRAVGESESVVDLQDPGLISQIFENPALAAPASAAREGLSRALLSIGTPL